MEPLSPVRKVDRPAELWKYLKAQAFAGGCAVACTYLAVTSGQAWWQGWQKEAAIARDGAEARGRVAWVDERYIQNNPKVRARHDVTRVGYAFEAADGRRYDGVAEIARFEGERLLALPDRDRHTPIRYVRAEPAISRPVLGNWPTTNVMTPFFFALFAIPFGIWSFALERGRRRAAGG